MHVLDNKLAGLVSGAGGVAGRWVDTDGDGIPDKFVTCTETQPGGLGGDPDPGPISGLPPIG